MSKTSEEADTTEESDESSDSVKVIGCTKPKKKKKVVKKSTGKKRSVWLKVKDQDGKTKTVKAIYKM